MVVQYSVDFLNVFGALGLVLSLNVLFDFAELAVDVFVLLILVCNQELAAGLVFSQ